MKTAKKRAGLENLRTMKSCTNKFRARTPQGALMEMARLAQEKERLAKEMENWRGRIKHIEARLEEIARMEAWLGNFAGNTADFAQLGKSGQSQKGGKSSYIPMEHKEIIVRY